MDLETFFDKVNHDILIDRLSRRIEDKRVLDLIRKYLKSGIMLNRVIVSNEEGTPQGGPFSPLLSNIMLDEVDKELEWRGHKFCRFADDCNIYVKNKKAGLRVLNSIKKRKDCYDIILYKYQIIWVILWNKKYKFNLMIKKE